MSKIYVDEIRPKTSGAQVIMPNRPAFLAYLRTNSIAYNALSGSGNLVPFNATMYNTGNMYSTSTYKFTAPVDGLYMVGFSLRVNSAGGYFHPHIDVNGAVNLGDASSLTAYVIHDGTGYEQATLQIPLQLTAGDEVNCAGHDGGLTAGTFQVQQCWFYGYLIG